MFKKLARFLGRFLHIKEKVRFGAIWNFEIRDALTGELKRTYTEHNLVPNVFHTAMAAQIAGQNTQNIGQNLYIALGSSSETPTVSDTQLNTEVIRKLANTNNSSGPVANIRAFFNQTEAVGIFRVFGLFMNGGSTVASATPNSGILSSKVATLISVAASETLTVTVSFTSTS